jgi:tetratricopeptide (TPR) repeat protein
LASLCAIAQTAAPASAPRNQYRQREQQLLDEIKNRPDDPRLHNELGVVQFYLGKGAAAESSFEKAIKLDPKNADARANLSFHYFRLGRQEAALELLKDAIALEPNNFLANYFSGLLYFARRQPVRAEIFIRKALSIQPDNLDARLDLIKIRAAQNHTLEAERQLDQLAVELPNDARVRYARAAFYAGQGRTSEAISEYKTVLAIAPESLDIKFEMAVLYFRARDYYNTLRMLEDYHKGGPSVESVYLMGHALAETGRLEEAEKWLKRAIELRENYFDARLQLGRLYFTLRKYNEAIEQLRRAVELGNANRFEGHHGAGSIKLKRGDTTGALKHLFRAAQLNSRSADIQVLLGRALGRAGNNSGAIDHFKQAIALEPNRVDAHYQLAMALRKAGRNQEAEEELKVVDRLNKEFRNRASGMEKNP